MNLIKLTKPDYTTYGGCKWGAGVEYTAPGNGRLCSPAYLHAYATVELALLMSPDDIDWWQKVVVWEAEGDVERADGHKLGCTRLRTLRIIDAPAIPTTARVRFAIYAVREVCDDKDWLVWADGWVVGKDRSAVAARAAADEATLAADEAAWAVRAAWAAYEATWAAHGAAWAAWAANEATLAAWAAMAAYGATRAAWAATRAARAADKPPLDLDAIARQAIADDAAERAEEATT